MHEENVDRFLDAQSKDKGNVDKEKLKNLYDNDVSLQTYIVRMTNKMKPSEQ